MFKPELFKLSHRFLTNLAATSIFFSPLWQTTRETLESRWNPDVPFARVELGVSRSVTGGRGIHAA